LVVVANLLAQRLVLATEPVRLGGPRHEVDQPFSLEGLLYEIDGPLPDCCHRRVQIAVP
jgi:hypothetical protein